MWIPPKRNVGRQVRKEKDKQFACLMGYVCPLHQDIKTSGCFCIKIPRDSLDFRPPNDGVCNYPLALAQIVNLTSSANHWHFGTAWNRSRNQTLPWRRCQGARGGGGGAVALQTIRSKSWCFISLINIPVASGCLCAGTDRLMNPRVEHSFGSGAKVRMEHYPTRASLCHFQAVHEILKKLPSCLQTLIQFI